MISRISILTLAALTLLTAGCGKEARLDRHLARAEKAFAASEFDRARIDYLNVLRIQPDHAGSIARMGVILFDMGSPRQAAPFLLRAALFQPENLDVRWRLALLYAMGGDPANAQKEANVILDLQSDHIEATLLLADLAYTPDEIASARAHIAQLRQRTGPRPALHLAEAQLLLREGEVEPGEAEIQQALALDPRFAPAHLIQATLHLARSNVVMAEQSFETAADLSPLRSDRRMRYIEFIRRSGAVDEARQLAQAIVKTAPDYLPALLFLARLNFNEQRPDDALKEIERILSRDTTHHDANVLRARIRLVKNDAPGAVAELEALSQLYPRSPELRFQLALASLINQDVIKAVSNLSQTIALDPNAIDAVLLLAQLNLARGEFNPAIQSLRELIRTQPGNGRARIALGQAYRAFGRSTEALAVYQGYTRDFPNDPQGAFNTGLVLRQLNRFEEARAAFEQTLGRDPRHQAAVAQLVELDLAADQPDAALNRAERLVRDNPDSAGAHLVLAGVHLACDRRAPAETELRKTLELDPNARAAQLHMARLFSASGRTREALAELESAVSRKTNDTAALLLIGTLHSEARDYEQARHAYERALRVNPNFTPALNNLAYLYVEKLHQPGRAYELARRARTLQPNDPAIADTLGWVHYHRGEYSESLNLLVESAGRLPGEPEVQFHLGMTHYMLGNEDAARAALEASLNASSVVSWGITAEQRLAVLNLDTTSPVPETVLRIEKAIRANPNDLVALVRLASIQQSNGAIDRAIQLCLEATKVSPNAVAPNLKLAQLYATRPKDQARALEKARKARNLAPSDPAVAITLGQVAFKSGDHAWAVSLLEECASRITNQPALFHDLAWARYSVGRVNDALIAMQHAQHLGLDSEQAEVANLFIELAPIHTDATKAGGAYERAQHVLKADPNFAPALMLTATVDHQNNRILPARQAAEQVLAQYKLFSPAHRLLGMLYIAAPPDDQKAYDHAAKAREAYPEDPAVAKTLGIASYRRADDRSAVELLSQSVTQKPEDPESLLYLALSQRRLDQEEQARQTYQRLMALAPDSAHAAEAMKAFR